MSSSLTLCFSPTVKVSEYPLVDGHHSMQIYMNAMKQCFLTLKRKQGSAYRDTREPQLDDFSYFAFHTPFSKMVQKSFMALILADIEVAFRQGGLKEASQRYPADLVQ